MELAKTAKILSNVNIFSLIRTEVLNRLLTCDRNLQKMEPYIYWMIGENFRTKTFSNQKLSTQA